MLENVIQINSGITINVVVSEKIQKNLMHVKRLYLESCYIVVVKLVDMQGVLLMVQ